MAKKYPPINIHMAVKVFFAPLGRYRGKGPMVHGMSNHKLRRVWVDPRSKVILSTFVHELYHIQHPDWTEEQVMRAEEQWEEFAPWREKAAVAKQLCKAIIATADELP